MIHAAMTILYVYEIMEEKNQLLTMHCSGINYIDSYFPY